jgi:hypothetical protein
MGSSPLTQPVLECTYFDIKVPCSVCGEKPSRRETGKCAVHSVAPYDPSRKGDWIDCYEGCLKHDAVARKRYMESNRRAISKAVIPPIEPTTLPTIARLQSMARHQNGNRLVIEALQTAWRSRGISASQIAAGSGTSTHTIESMLRSNTRQISFMEVCNMLGYLHDFDQQRHVNNKKGIA